MPDLLLKIGVALMTIAAVGVAVANSTGTNPVARPQLPPALAEVAALVDGDTFDVRLNEATTRVRLAYARTPAPATASQPSACLASEASAELASIIPVGTRLSLIYSKDRFGRPAAASTTPDGRFVDAEIVRAGFAHVMQTDAGAPTPPAMVTAAREALVNKRGMHSPDIACTVPGQVKALARLVDTVPVPPDSRATTVELSNAANRATEARMAAEELDSTFTQDRQDITWLVLGPGERAELQAQVRSARDQASAMETALRNATSMKVNQNSTQASTQREAARLAKILADIRKAEADRAAQAARRAAAARAAQADAAAETRARADAAQARKAEQRRRDSGSSGSDNSESDTSGTSGRSKRENSSGE